MQQKNEARTEKIKNLVLIALAVLLVAVLIIRAVSSASDGAVSAEYVTSGPLQTALRGSGTVASQESVEVSSDKACMVFSVPVQEGDEVRCGDVLIECSDYAAADVKALQEELDALVLEYELELVEQSGGAYPKEQGALERAQEALEKAKADCDKLYVSDAKLSAAKDKITQCEKAVAAKEDEIARLEAAGISSTLSLADAEAAYNKAMLVHKDNYYTIVNLANTWMQQDGLTVEEKTVRRNSYIAAVAADLTAGIAKFKEQITEAEKNEKYDDIDSYQRQIENYQTLLDSYNAVQPALEKYEAAKSSEGLVSAKEELVSLNRQKTTATAELEELKTQKTSWQTANDALEGRRTAVDTALEALKTAQRDDEKNSVKLAAAADKIDAKRQELAELTNDGEPVSIKSKVNGIVTSILTTPGSSAEAGSALMTIEMPDMGYTVSFPVPRGQSALLAAGDAAVAASGDEKQEAVLKEISAYPDDPSQQLLTFELKGAASAGSELELTVTKGDEEYDLVIPSAALREDSSGCFVLTVSPRQGLFGTRYVIARVPVTVLARNDSSAAVSGELSAGTMVVTTHPCTLKSGDTVDIE